MYCKNCRAAIADDKTYCPNCGGKLDADKRKISTGWKLAALIAIVTAVAVWLAGWIIGIAIFYFLVSLYCIIFTAKVKINDIRREIDQEVKRREVARMVKEVKMAEISMKKSAVLPHKSKSQLFLDDLNNLPMTEISTSDSLIQRKRPSRIFVDDPCGPWSAVKRQLSEFVCIDCETTGLNPENDCITELSAIRFVDFRPVAGWSTLINPCCRIPAAITHLTGIDDSMVEDAPTMQEVRESFIDFVGESKIVAYNAEFDLKFLSSYQIDFPGNDRVYDALEIERAAFPEYNNHKLDYALNRIGIYRQNAHRSLSDAMAAAYVLQASLEKLENRR